MPTPVGAALVRPEVTNTLFFAFGAVTLRVGRPSGLRDRCPLEVNELPAPVLPNEHAGAATLLIHLPVLVLSLGGGTTGLCFERVWNGCSLNAPNNPTCHSVGSTNM